MSEIDKADNLVENIDDRDNTVGDNQNKTYHRGYHGHDDHRHSHSQGHSHNGRTHKRYHKRRRHSGRHSRSNNDSKKFIKFLKRRKSLLINIVSCTISVVLLILLAINLEIKPKSGWDDTSIVDVTKASIKIESTVFIDDVSITNQAVNAFIGDNTGKTAHTVYGEYQGYTQDLDGEIPVEYTYKVSGLPSGVNLEMATLELSENADFKEGKIYFFEDGKNSVFLYHLIPGTEYHYRLNLSLSSGNNVSTVGSFRTANSPRILSIDGIHNVRDIGGWKTTDGKVIKYGLLYRGTELDGGVEPTYRLTEKGLADMIATLGIKFDMDLRAETDSKGNILGENVTHKNYPVYMYSDIFAESNEAIVREIFAQLANEDSYPIYMHCTYGRDRTGTVCYLLEALLGMSDNDLRKEYELSAFKDSYADLEAYAAFTARVDMFEGNTTQEKVESYLRSIGVTDEEISNIRNIFLGE